jgi:uncharacterized repeat protein (TIGR01451 family)
MKTRNFTYSIVIAAKAVMTFLLFSILSHSLSGQCVAVAEKISGIVFHDKNNDGIKTTDEVGIQNVLVSIYDSGGSLTTTNTSSTGSYEFSGLTNGSKYRIQYDYLSKYVSSFVGTNSGSSVQFVTVPSCSASLGLVDNSEICSTNPKIFTTCFVQGPTTKNENEATIVGLDYNFDNSSEITKFASHGETGSIWGLSWKSSTNELFSSALVKQYAGLTSHGHDAILKTKVTPTGNTTSKFVKLSELGLTVAPLNTNDETVCDYGKQVGRTGLGSMVITPGEDFLYVINISDKALVKIPTNNPTGANTSSIKIPNPQCADGEYFPFALKYYQGKLYIGITCTKLLAGEKENSAVVYEFDPNTEMFKNIFSTNYLKGYWHDDVPAGIVTQHWFTDIDFADADHMILSFTDRIGHKFCKSENILDEQNPDILMAWNDNGVWKLESNGTAGPGRIGSGVGNGDGPGNGEFFGNDFWPGGPDYHPEVALGSVFALPGSNSVVAMVYDPVQNTYSGGLHRYNTLDGTILGSKELYSNANIGTPVLFGKATGFGEVIGRCAAPTIQIGNYVWIDTNENGLQDAGENPVSNMKLFLYDSNCVLIDSAVTNATGNYVFSNLTASAQYFIGVSSSSYNADFGLFTIGSNKYTLTIANANQTLNSNAVINTSSTCSKGLISVTTGVTNHTFDLGLIPAKGFDLALKNELVSAGLVKKNDTVNFKITVFNQGGIAATNIKVVDYIPTGYMVDQAANTQWSFLGNKATTTLPGTLLPGESKSVNIRLILMSSNRDAIINIAEIVSATDFDGKLAEDVDSKPDDNSSNDTGGLVNTNTDNEINNSGAIDEDDQDPATPNVLDLALKMVVNEECAVGGDCVEAIITVYNQGNINVTGFKVVDYLNSELNNSALNTSWTYLGGKMIYTGGEILVGESKNIPVVLCVQNNILNSSIVNYAEIFEISALGGVTTTDFDSTPDSTQTNDAGGVHSTNQDNFVNGVAGVEEDDHDPIVIGVKYVDLALKLTTNKRRVQSNEDVCFEITVYNQGTQTLNEVDLIDYIPAGLSLNDLSWSMGGDNISATKKVVFSQGFKPGAEHKENICFKTLDMTNRFYLVNYAEVAGAMDMCLHSVGSKDVDSKADVNKTNDIGGKPQTSTDNIVTALKNIDEDDHDPAVLINYVIASGNCNCKRNATNTINGQFNQQLSVRGPKGMTWFIEQVTNLYSITSAAPPALPTPFVTGPTGYVLTEVSVDSVTSDYFLDGVFEDGKSYQIVLRSSDDDFETLTGGGCAYTPTPVTGLGALCVSSIQEYSVPVIPGGYSVSVTGGTIISSNPDSSKVSISWGSAIGTYPLIFKAKSTTACYEPGVLNVGIGSIAGSLACKSNVQLSLDGDCSVEVSPALLIAGQLAVNAAFSVMVLDGSTPLNGNVVNASHIGKTLTAKLIDGCSGNSCWGNILVEDKVGPKIKCVDTVEVQCFNFEEYPGPLAEDNCTAIQKLSVLDSSSTILSCDPKYNIRINKSYIATDMYGNKSSICKQTILVKRIELDSIKFPADITMANAFVCNGFVPDAEGHPNASVAGSPKVRNMSLYPSFDKACNVAVVYTDKDHGLIGCVRKISRYWTVYEGWCTEGVILRDTQTIIITDLSAPKFTCPKNISVSASEGNCEANVSLPAVTNITDDCSLPNEITVSIATPNGLVSGNGGSVTLPAGIHNVTYKVTDKCSKVDSCTITVTVIDKTPPTMVCNQGLVVGLNSIGSGFVNALMINDGSFDACGLDSFRIRRMTANTSCGIGTTFGTSVALCCSDVAQNVMVELKAWDINGNSNSCMVEVKIQDNTAPTITCPSNVEISCEENFDLKNLNKYGTASANDDCTATVTEIASLESRLCRTGTITRVFTARDGSNMTRCTSFIEIVRSTKPIEVVWPLDYNVDNRCSANLLHPDSLPVLNSRPKITQGICDAASATYDDSEAFSFDNGKGSCFLIRRRWTVIDFCRSNEVGYEPLVYDQLITGSNTIDPTIKLDTAQLEVCTVQNNCVDAPIKLSAILSDDCTAAKDLEWRYDIDLDFNGTFTSDISRIGIGSRIVANGTYKIGKHIIRFTAEDLCGNQVSIDHKFEIKNCNKPVATCKNGAAITLTQMVMDGQLQRMACLKMSTLNASSTHPCGEELTYSFTSNIKDSIKCFTCMDLGATSVSLYATDRFGNQSSCTTLVDVQNNDPRSVNIVASRDSICPSSTVTLTAVGVGKILWSTGDTSRVITINPATTTTYRLSVTSTDNCTLMASKVITVVPNPEVRILTNLPSDAAMICNGTSIILTASGGGTYRWSNTSSSNSITVSPSVNTNYIVTVTNSFGCSSTLARSVSVIPISSNAIIASTTNAKICNGQSTTLSVNNLLPNNTYKYRWSTTDTTSTITVNPGLTTVYTVTVTNAQGCSITATSTVVVNPLPVVTITGVDTACASMAVRFTGPEGYVNYTWSTAIGATRPGRELNIFTTTNSVFTLTVTDSVGCTNSATKTLIVNPLPAASISGALNICLGDTIRLTANGGTKYSWSSTIPLVSNANSQSIKEFSAASSISFQVLVTDANGCTDTETAIVTNQALPTVSFTGDSTICNGESTSITASGGTSYRWSNGATGATISVTPATTTTYVVTVTNGQSCINTRSVTVTVNTPSAITLNPAIATVCAGSPITLNVSGASTGSTYSWNGGAVINSNSFTITPTATTNVVNVLVTDLNMCTLTASKTITINPLPNVTIAGNTQVCNGGSTVLKASGAGVGGTYLWSTTQNTDSIIVTPTVDTRYTVTATTSNGCTASSFANVVIVTLPTIGIDGNTTICASDTAKVTASGGSTYLWSTGATTASVNLTPNTTTTYRVTVTSGANCSTSRDVVITVKQRPTPAIAGTNNICAGTSTNLTATGVLPGASYLWTPGNLDNSSISVSPATTTTYTLQVTSDGCSSSTTYVVTVKPTPVAGIVASKTIICVGETVRLIATGGTTYLWKAPVTPSSEDTVFVTPASNTVYEVRAETNGCVDTQTVSIIVNPLPSVSIAPSIAEICPGTSITLTASGGVSYLWNSVPQTSTASLNVNTAGTYIVTVTNANGCSATGSRIVTEKPNPVIDLVASKPSICIGDSSTLSVTGVLSGSTYLWSTTETTATIKVKPTVTTKYFVTVTTPGGCLRTDSVTINVDINNATVARCKDVIRYLDSLGSTVVITAADINNGSTAGCGGGELTFSISPNSFRCNDAARLFKNGVYNDTTVTLTVTANGLSSTCTAKVSIRDTIKPTVTCPIDYTINCDEFTSIADLRQPTPNDMCGGPTISTTIVLDSTNSCKVGTITRIFGATDFFGNVGPVRCTTKVTIVASGGLAANQIIYPRDTTLTACTSSAPTNTGSVSFAPNASGCSKTSSSFIDTRINVVGICNYTISRVWTVIDSCQLSTTNVNAGKFTGTQLIQIRDLTGPVISGYEDLVIQSDTCPVRVDYNLTGLSITDCNLRSITNNAPRPFNRNSGDISGIYDGGTTPVTITATDSCGNVSTKLVNITVLVESKPNAELVCLKVIKTITDNLTAVVKAEDLVFSIAGGCISDFQYSFSNTNINDNSRTFTCANIGSQFTTTYAYRNGVLHGSCTVLVAINNNSNFCPSAPFRVSGKIITEEKEAVEGVVINLEGSGMNSISTNDKGQYDLPLMDPKEGYMLKPLKNDGLLEGINTLDLIIIQRHILGTIKLTSPYKWIAADVNNDKKISISDLLDLRKVLLGAKDKFTNNTSWKTVDRTFVFPDPNNPLNSNYPLNYSLFNPAGPMEVDFIGVKIGDVNGTFKAKNTNRSKPVSLISTSKFVEAGSEVEVDFEANEGKNIDGLQLAFDVSKLSNISIESNVFESKDIHYSNSNGVLELSITSDVSIESKGKLFTIKGTALESGETKDLTKLTKRGIENQIYESLEAKSVNHEWKFGKDELFIVKQNAPNPWNENTLFEYVLPLEGEVKFNIKDVKGQLIYSKVLNGNKGVNSVNFNANEINNLSGVFFYEFQFGNDIQQGKMIRVN